VPDYLLQVLREREIDAAAAIHAAEHGFLNQFQLSDVKTDCRVAKDDYSSDESKAKRPPMLMFYDSAGKTGGISSRAFDHGKLFSRIFEGNDVHSPGQCRAYSSKPRTWLPDVNAKMVAEHVRLVGPPYWTRLNGLL